MPSNGLRTSCGSCEGQVARARYAARPEEEMKRLPGSKARQGRGGDRKQPNGYARVSTRDQNLDLQLAALRGAGCDRVFEDTMSGTDQGWPPRSRQGSGSTSRGGHFHCVEAGPSWPQREGSPRFRRRPERAGHWLCQPHRFDRHHHRLQVAREQGLARRTQTHRDGGQDPFRTEAPQPGNAAQVQATSV